MNKRVVTLQYERGKSGKKTKNIEDLLIRLESARRDSSIVVTTPAAIKSIFLHLIDCLQIAVRPTQPGTSL